MHARVRRPPGGELQGMSAAAAGGSQRNGSSLRDRNMKKKANGTSPGLAFARRKTKEETTRSTRSSGRSAARASPAPPAFEKLVRGDHLLVRADYREESYGIRREAFAQQVPPRRLKEAARARASLARFCFCSFGERYVLRFRPLLTLLDEVIRCLGGHLSTVDHLVGQRSPYAGSRFRVHLLGREARSRRGAALLRWRPNQSLRRRRGRRQLDPSRREERQRVRWPTVLLSSATDGGLPLVLARFVRGLSTHQGSGCLRQFRTAATAAKCHRAPVDSHRVADQMPTGPSMSRRRAPHAASPLPRG